MTMPHHKTAQDGRHGPEHSPAYRPVICLSTCEELPFEIVYNTHHAGLLLCTPTMLRELAVGWLHSQGYVEKASEITMLGVCEHMRSATVASSPDRWEEVSAGKWLLTSGCSGGLVSDKAMTQLKAVPRPAEDIPIGFTRELCTAMIHRAELYRTTGGVHSAAIGSEQGDMVSAEDIGRHNAVDKVIGASILSGADLRSACLVSSGRVSSEMVIKAARAGIPVIASLSVPTSMAVNLAKQASMCIIGRVLSSRPRVYVPV